MVYVQNPGSIAMRFCTFRHATIILQHVNVSIIQNCEFSQTDSAAITVEGYPKEDKNWTYRGLNSKISNLCSLQKKPERKKSGELFIPKSAFSLSTATTSHQKSRPKTHYQRQISGDPELGHRKMSHDFDLQSHDQDGHAIQGSNVPQLGEFRGAHVHRRQSHTESFFSSNSRNDGSDFDDGDTLSDKDSGIKRHKNNVSGASKKHSTSAHKPANGKTTTGDMKHHKEKIKQIENFVTDCARYSNPGTSGESTIGENDELDLLRTDLCEDPANKAHTSTAQEIAVKLQRQHNDSSESDSDSDSNENKSNVPPLDLHSLASLGNQGQRDNEAEQPENDREHRVHRSLSSSEVSLHTASSNDVSSDEEGAGGYNSGICCFFPFFAHFSDLKISHCIPYIAQ